MTIFNHNFQKPQFLLRSMLQSFPHCWPSLLFVLLWPVSFARSHESKKCKLEAVYSKLLFCPFDFFDVLSTVIDLLTLGDLR